MKSWMPRTCMRIQKHIFGPFPGLPGPKRLICQSSAPRCKSPAAGRFGGIDREPVPQRRFQKTEWFEMYRKIDACRTCGNPQLALVTDLGEQYLTGVFPAKPDTAITKGPLRLVKCHGGPDVCGLLQLEHNYDLGELYGENYGYHSSLNQSMVRHLKAKVDRILGAVTLAPGDFVIDI